MKLDLLRAQLAAAKQAADKLFDLLPPLDVGDAHAFIAAFQTTRGMAGLPKQITTEPTVRIEGPRCFGVTTPALYPGHAKPPRW